MAYLCQSAYRQAFPYSSRGPLVGSEDPLLGIPSTAPFSDPGDTWVMPPLANFLQTSLSSCLKVQHTEALFFTGVSLPEQVEILGGKLDP